MFKKYDNLSNKLFAKFYDSLNTLVEWRLKDLRIEICDQAIGDVLEIGGGTGANLKYFSRFSSLTFLEPNPFMAEILSNHAKKLNREIEIISAEGESIPFPDSSFDTVITSLTLCMVNNVDQVMNEILRVLKPGGKLIFYEHVVDKRSTHKFFQTLLNPNWKYLTTGCNLTRDIEKVIHSTGFQTVEIKSFQLTIILPISLPNIIGNATKSIKS